MLISILTALSANIFTIYPGFIEPSSRVQVATDKGLMIELVIACKPGEGIMSFSKIERKFCVPDATCYRRFSRAYSHLCK